MGSNAQLCDLFYVTYNLVNKEDIDMRIELWYGAKKCHFLVLKRNLEGHKIKNDLKTETLVAPRLTTQDMDWIQQD
jgi:hypothetical protein